MEHYDFTPCIMTLQSLRKPYFSKVQFCRHPVLEVSFRDGSIPKFQLIPIPILEFLCQPILELKKKIIVGSVRNLYFKCTQVTQAFKWGLSSKNSQTTLFFDFPIFHTSLSWTEIVKSVQKKYIVVYVSIN